MSDTPWGRVAAEKLQMSARIAELEAQFAATPPAWGPPQAQPDAEGWWAFDGETPWRHSEQGEAYRARKMCFVWEYSGNPGQWWVDRWGIDAKKFVGRWWRLTMPWEVKP